MRRAIILLAVPMMLELVMESTVGLVDVFFVGRLGSAAVATVGLTGSVIVLVYAIAMGLSMGTTAIVSRRIGKGDSEGAGVAAWHAILAGILSSVPVGLCGVILSRKLLAWMGGTDAVIAGYQYTAMLFGGAFTIFLLIINNAILRAAGDPVLSMRSLVVANLINIALNPLLIFGIGPLPELGLFGAALATTVGRAVGVIYQFTALVGGSSRVTITRSSLGWNPEVVRSLLRISVLGMIGFFVATATWLGLMRIVALFGHTVLAGYTISLRLIQFAIFPCWGVGNATATLVGQNLGAGEPQRAERAVLMTGFVNFSLIGCIAALFWILAEPLIGIFSSEPEVIARGAESLRIISFGYIFRGYSMAFSQAFNGSGNTLIPVKIHLLCYWVWQLPLAYYLSTSFSFGATGVYLSVVISSISWLLVGYILFRRGDWKKQKI